MKQYIVDAFTNEVFRGNPAAVCVMDHWPEESWMMHLAAENNLSETAFIVKEAEGYRLRWFTPRYRGGALRPRDPGIVLRSAELL